MLLMVLIALPAMLLMMAIVLLPKPMVLMVLAVLVLAVLVLVLVLVLRLLRGPPLCLSTLAQGTRHYEAQKMTARQTGTTTTTTGRRRKTLSDSAFESNRGQWVSGIERWKVDSPGWRTHVSTGSSVNCVLSLRGPVVWDVVALALLPFCGCFSFFFFKDFF
jgi:ABC-type branched-subunit amino acid transport system permease subunit